MVTAAAQSAILDFGLAFLIPVATNSAMIAKAWFLPGRDRPDEKMPLRWCNFR
jgi:hypothetical protein